MPRNWRERRETALAAGKCGLCYKRPLRLGTSACDACHNRQRDNAAKAPKPFRKCLEPNCDSGCDMPRIRRCSKHHEAYLEARKLRAVEGLKRYVRAKVPKPPKPAPPPKPPKPVKDDFEAFLRSIQVDGDPYRYARGGK